VKLKLKLKQAEGLADQRALDQILHQLVLFELFM